jgi:hypothetical protein
MMPTADGNLSFKPVILFREHDDDDSLEGPNFDHEKGRAMAFFSSVEKAEAFRREFIPDDGQGPGAPAFDLIWPPRGHRQAPETA